MIYHELCRLRTCMLERRKLRIFRYWLKIRYRDNCVIKSCYDDYKIVTHGHATSKMNCVNWASNELYNIKDELRKLGLE